MFSGKFLVWGCFTNIYSLTDSYIFSGTPQFLEPGALVQMCKSKHIALVAPTYTPTRVILKVLEGPHNQAISVRGWNFWAVCRWTPPKLSLLMLIGNRFESFYINTGQTSTPGYYAGEYRSTWSYWTCMNHPTKCLGFGWICVSLDIQSYLLRFGVLGIF